MAPSAGPVDLSMKDLVERTQTRKTTLRGPLKKIQESEANHRPNTLADDRSGTFKWWNNNQNREERPKASKVVVHPSKANGEHPREQLPEPPRKSFGEFLEYERYGDGAESLQILRGVTPEPVPLGGHSPGATRGSRAVTPTHRNHHENHHPSRSPSRSPLRSPLRSPSRSSLASPHREHTQRAAQLASASSPARLGGYGRDVDAIDWTNPAASPMHWGNTMFSPTPSVKEHYAKEHHRPQQKHQHHRSVSSGDQRGQKLLLADVLSKENTAPSGHTAGQKAQSKSSKHCSGCLSTTHLKTRCVVCRKIYCGNCVEENMKSMPEGRICKRTCLDKTPRSQNISEDCNCWPFSLPTGAKNSESKSARRRGTSQSQVKLRANTNSTTHSRETLSSQGSSRNPRTETSSIASSR